MKNIILFVIVTLGVPGAMTAKNGNEPKAEWQSKTVTAQRLSERIVLDGRLIEQAWQAPAISGFTQNDPEDGQPASEKTEVWLAYDDEAIYVAACMHDSEPARIISLLGRRDDFVEADYFIFYIDPYNDKRSGFKFAINPSGSLADWSLFNDEWDDRSWDGHWQGRARCDERGWTAEMKIPFDQLRFKKQEGGNYAWGVNFRRHIKRKNEIASFSWRSKTESGFVSRFARLEGIKDIEPKKLVEFIPYAAAKANFLRPEEGNPFRSGEETTVNGGLDLKLGLSNSLTLDLSLNPDFGQVEVDPAVINLSAAESYYSEKRPLFLEGAPIFRFGEGGASDRIGADWGDPQFFYSRRIGRSPQGFVSGGGHVDVPEWSTILGAVKLSGKIGDWSVGLLSALTEREYARVDLQGERSRLEVEPFANYSVLRAQKEFGAGRQGLGFIATSVLRDFQSESLAAALPGKAFTLGVDGWTFLDKKKAWVATGWLGLTSVQGSQESIAGLQQSFPHYFQRPDADHLHFDPEATALNGWAGRFTLNKQKGNLLFNAALGFISPGFDSRDMGFQWDGDVINGHVMVGYRSYRKWWAIQNWNLLLFTQRNYNFAGDRIGEQRLIAISNITFTSFWGFYFQMSHNPDTWAQTRTWGGPLMLLQRFNWFDWAVESDGRRPLVVSFGGFHLLSDWGRTTHQGSLTLRWKPRANLSLSASPSYERQLNSSQWVTRIDDPLMTSTYGARYVFADLDQKKLACSIRLNWIFSPQLSLQAYIQPFIAVGAYRNFKEFARPRTYDFNVYGSGASTIAYGAGEYAVSPGDGGQPFSIADPDFNYKSLRGTVVLRWEYRLGSTLYLVWTQNRADFQDPGDLSFGRDLGAMLRAPGDNIVMLKATYRFKI
ncbi:MAG: carbohydrate binding family 9 domain-containing protein [Acidobacteria bacterium]|nr:carbohydrate binding family 9 domain-containing protein [Acidobacteriota bacterium]